MVKRTALPLQYSRIKDLLADRELIKLAEKAKGKPLKPTQKERRGDLVDNILMPEISKFASCNWGKGYEQWYDHNLWRAVQKTAELLGLGTRNELKGLSNEEVCEKIQSILRVRDYERILHLSEEERILTLRAITPQYDEKSSAIAEASVKNYDSVSSSKDGLLSNPVSQMFISQAIAPTGREFVKLGGELASRAIRSGDTAKFLKVEAPVIKGKLSTQASTLKRDIIKTSVIYLIVATVLIIPLVVYAIAEPKIRKRREEKESRMAHVVADLVACLCFDPDSVLNVDKGSQYESKRRAYVTELNKVHPDRVLELSAEQQASAYGRMQELILAWEIIQAEHANKHSL